MSANINDRDDTGMTALDYAVMCGHEELIHLLRRNGGIEGKVIQSATFEHLERRVSSDDSEDESCGTDSSKFWSNIESKVEMTRELTDETPVNIGEFEICFRDHQFTDQDFDDIQSLLMHQDADEDSIFPRYHFAPPKTALTWMLRSNDQAKDRKSVAVGIRHVDSKLLIGFVAAWTIHNRIDGQILQVAEAGSLVLHRDFRGRGLAPVLMTELMTQSQRKGIYRAIHTSHSPLPLAPIAMCRYWHRYIDIPKLVECRFYHLPDFSTLTENVQYFSVDETRINDQFREMESRDVPQVVNLLNAYLEKFKLSQFFDDVEVTLRFLPQLEEGKMVYCYLREDGDQITDMYSFYVLDGVAKVSGSLFSMRTADSYYFVPGKLSSEELMMQCLIKVKQLGCHFLSTLDNFENQEFLEKLKFREDKNNRMLYHLLNCKASQLSPSDIGIAFW
eukprot:TRINITY_DN5497_c3_g1_i1.p1 TRINITY_DN5497_c3_g1~~TRINITY_DN5497_c3_g1_i1.p1  ORF type:complete len:511 (+),score=135.17 TRINITY_DN5497_c3_g1_i1:194-1534(+)